MTYCVQITWSDAPHVTKEMRDEELSRMPPHMRDARTKGIPQLGSGVIYPVPQETYIYDPQDVTIQSNWPKAYGMDVGWNRTAAVWGALDPYTAGGRVYIYDEYSMGQREPASHAQSLKYRGEWIRGAIDPASAGASQKDGSRLIEEYRNLGLHLAPADNAVEAGLFGVYEMLTTDRLKISTACRNLLAELRIYRRDENGRVVKQNDHCCDALRYLIMTGMTLAQTEPQDDDDADEYMSRFTRSELTGY